MALTNDSFVQPKLRPGVEVAWHASGAAIHYRRQGCDIECGAEDAPDLRMLMTALQAGRSTSAELAALCPSLSEQLPELLLEFDRLGLLIEAEYRAASGVASGSQ